MAPEPDDLQEARRQVKALEGVLRRSGWYGRGSLQDAQYRWAATGLSVEAIEAYLAAGIADPRVAAEFCFELGISAKQIQLAGIGEQVSIGSMSVEDAATAILGLRAAGGLDQYQAALYQEAAGDLGSVLKEGSRWWQARIQRLAGFLDDQPVPSKQVDWLSQQSDHLLLGWRDAAASWAGPLTIAVAQQELERLEGALGPGGPPVSDPLMALVFGGLATRELTRRLGERVQAAIQSPPAYVTAVLGPYPEADLAQLTWMEAVLAIEGFRQECGIDDPEHALGGPDLYIPLAARPKFQSVNRALTSARVTLEQGCPRTSSRDLTAADDLAALERLRDPDAELDADWGAGQLVDPDGMRPDEELTWRLREAIPTEILPAGYVETAAALPAEELAVRWGRAVEHHLRGDLWDPLHPHGGPAALWAAAISDEVTQRVDARLDLIAADPPAYITGLLGGFPAEAERQGEWLSRVEQVEEYRLVTGTTNPTHALGPAPAPDSSWQQCWRRELAQELADARLLQMAYQQRVIGSPAERNDLAIMATSTVDPWFGLRPPTALVDESQELSIGELRRRVAAARPLLADRPENPATEVRDAQLRQARRLEYREQEEAALTAAATRCTEAPRRADRAAARRAVDEHRLALGRLDAQLVDVGHELTRLDEAQAAYFDWCRQHALQVLQGQAAAQVLQERETLLLEDLAAYPPAYLVAELGQAPTNRDGRAAWLRGALAVERHRAAYQIHDPERAFGNGHNVGRFEQPGRRQDQQRVREIVDDTRHAITESLTRELDTGLSVPGGEDPPGLAISA
jgi:hypothetical protein